MILKQMMAFQLLLKAFFKTSCKQENWFQKQLKCAFGQSAFKVDSALQIKKLLGKNGVR